MCVYILHGFTWYVYIMYICDASIDPQMRRDMPRRIGRLIRKVLKMLQLLWLQSFHFLGDVTHQTHLAAGHQDQGDFSYPPEKTPPKSMASVEIPAKKTWVSRVFFV